MKITRKQIDDEAAKRQVDSINDGKDLLKWAVIWWSLCAVVSVVALFTNGLHFSTLALIAISVLLVRIGNMLCEISVNIRTTIKQNDDLRLLMLANTSFEENQS